MSKRHLVEAAIFAVMLLIFFVILFMYLTQEPAPAGSESRAGSNSASFET